MTPISQAFRVLVPDLQESALEKAVSLLFSQQDEAGYWWYTLEANETIGAGFIQLMHFLGDVDDSIQSGLVRRLLSEQQNDGSWAIFYGGPGDLSTTIECYFALKLAGHSASEPPLIRAREFILREGGLMKIRVFSRIHLALFGLIPWSACPTMPTWFMLLPSWCGASIYEFSTWARASIVPLLLLDAAKPVRKVPFDLDELYCEAPDQRIFQFNEARTFFSLENFFLLLDKVLKLAERLPWHPGKKKALRKAEMWTREHISRTEDIYPAMAYAVLGLSAMGYPNDDPTIKKGFEGLKRFQQHLAPSEVIHQQCCISPNWDTPWAAVALLEAGVHPNDPRLLQAARYMISKEVSNFEGDWKVKNRKGPTGGWAFEFENDYFPDVDDTIEALHFLKGVGLPSDETQGPIQRGLGWILSMQCDNGGWAAFDKNNVSEWVNEIPFSDHGACLDPPTPDITGRMIELLASFGTSLFEKEIGRALRFLWKTQEPCGAWRGRWGVNYIYGTWCVLTGLASVGADLQSEKIQKAVDWLKSIQNYDGGWGESCLSDKENHYVPLGVSAASQTAWAVMALVAAGETNSSAVFHGVQWLKEHQTSEGGWDEPYFTGTGFPGHFYLRYHGYRYYFPTLALARYFKALAGSV